MLFAQDNWADNRWVGAARFSENQGWTGRAALDEVCYVPDLLAELSRHNHSEPYLNEMFGRSGGPGTRVEAIALPLRLGHQRIGVLTACRRSPKSSSESGFTTNDVSTLSVAADDIASLVSAVETYQRGDWQNGAREARTRIYQDFIAALDGGTGAEEVLCRGLVKFFASSVESVGKLWLW